MHIFRNLSIKLKLILIIQIVSLFSLLIGFSYIIIRNIADYKAELINNAIINANLIGEYCAVPLAFDVSENANETLEKLRNIPSIDVGIVYNKNNEIFAEFYLDRQKDKSDNPPIKKSGSYYERDYLHVYQTIQHENAIAGTIYLKVSTRELFAKIKSYLIAMALLMIFILFINYILALYLQRVISGPVLNLTAATKMISTEGNYQLRVEKRGNDEVGMLVDEYNSMLEQIFIREETLKQRTNELSETLENLQKTQRKLIDAEKMAALGQLISGVAHEINTPLGAITSSIGNIKKSLGIVMKDYPTFINSLPEKNKAEFFILTDDSFGKKYILTTKEERLHKQRITGILESYHIQNAYYYSDTLVDMLVYEDVEKYINLLQDDNADEIFSMAARLTGLQRSIDNIDYAAARASKVVFALKNFSRIGQSQEKELADVTQGIETVLTLYYNQIKQGIEVSKTFEDIPQILCYPDELNQVWTNLLHNAIYAMNLSGKLDISTRALGNQIVVSITDNGKGIPPEIMDRIFDPFFSTKPIGEGTGIGLDIVKRIIEKHEGKIEVESIPGKTTFRIFLPVNTDNSELKIT